MPVVDLPLFSGVYKNIDETMTRDLSYKLIDGILDEAPSISSRPGFNSVGTLNPSYAIDGMVWVDKLQRFFALCGGDLWVLTTGFSGTNLSSGGGVSINIGRRPTFAFDGTNIYVANGGRIMYSNGSGVTAFIADADAPTNVTHIALLDSYLLANNSVNDTWYYAEPGTPLVWAALDFASAESEPDAVVSLNKFRGEVYLHGRETLEVWENNGQTPFERINGASFDTGCIAPHSVIKLDNEIMWLSDDRYFVKFAGGGIERLSTQYDKEIKTMAVVSDCTADRYDIQGKTLIVFQFPSEQRTLVYNLTNNNWGEFGYWNTAGGFHEAFLGACHVYIPETETHILGSRKATGKLYQMSEDYTTDDGNIIKCLSRSGHIDFGTNEGKRNNETSFRVKRGYVTDASEPVCTMRYRDENEDWSQEEQISLGQMGEYNNTIRLKRLGRYRTRQFEFACTDAVGFVFSGAKEDMILVR